MNKIETLHLIAAARMLWPSWKDAPSTEREASLMGDAWQVILDDVDAQVGLAALQILASEGREFVPPVGVIRRTAVLTIARQLGELPPDVDQAWLEVRQRTERGNVAWNAPWSHECVDQAVSSIGWYELRTSTNQESLRAHFAKFYAEAVERFQRDLVVSPSARAAISGWSLRQLVERGS